MGRLQDDSGLQSRSSLLAASARDMALAVDEAVSYAKFEGQDAAERKLNLRRGRCQKILEEKFSATRHARE